MRRQAGGADCSQPPSRATWEQMTKEGFEEGNAKWHATEALSQPVHLTSLAPAPGWPPLTGEQKEEQSPEPGLAAGRLQATLLPVSTLKTHLFTVFSVLKILSTFFQLFHFRMFLRKSFGKKCLCF